MLCLSGLTHHPRHSPFVFQVSQNFNGTRLGEGVCLRCSTHASLALHARPCASVRACVP
jgi:hypothetical protein